MLLVSTFGFLVRIVQAANPTMSYWSVSPTSAVPGQYLTVKYYITNPNSASMSVGLGFSIRLSGTSGDGISDPARDKIVSVSPGSNWYDRLFLIPTNTIGGSYECVWAIWSGAPGSSTQYASSGWQVNWLTIQTTASVTFSANGLGSTSGTVLTVNSIVRSVPYTATYTVGQSVSFVWYTPVNDYWSSTTRYDWLSTTGLSVARSGSFVVPSGGGSVTASYAKSYQVSFSVSPAGGGTTNPSGVQWFRAGLYQLIGASPASGYSFQSWTKGLLDSISFDNPSSASTWALINGAGTITANFQQIPTTASVTFSANGLGLLLSGTVLVVQGTARSVPYTATYNVGQSVSFEWYTPVYDLVSTTRYEWWRTTGLSTARSGSFTVPAGGGSVVADYATSYQVTFAVNPGGSGSTSPNGVQWYRSGSMQSISASPSPAYDFLGWSKGLLDSISFDSSSSASTYAWIYGAGTITANFQLIPTVADPYFSPTPGTYTGSVTVTISCSTSGAVIHYTTDGTTPTTSSPTYSNPITVSTTTTFYAKAFKSGYIDSNVVPAVYTIAYTVTFSANGLGSTSGTVLTVNSIVRSVPYTATYTVGQSVSFVWYTPVNDYWSSTTRYDWLSTTGLSVARSGSFVVPSGGGSVTASYAKSYQVSFSVSPAGGGTTNPSGVQWFRAGLYQLIGASPASGYSFQSWTKGLLDSISFDNPSSASTWALINGAGTITANFQQIPTTASVTFSANGLGLLLSGTVLVVQGTARSVPYTATYNVGQSVSFEWYTPVYDLVSTTRYEWWRTTGLSTARSGSFTVPAGGGSVVADYATSYQVTFAVNPGGSGSTSPNGVQWYRSGSMQSISASPSPAYDFLGWSKGLLDSISFDSSSSASTYAWIYGSGTITANYVLIADIANIQRPNIAYQQGNIAEVQVFVENTGTVSHSYKAEFFIIGPIGTTKGPYLASGIVMYYESSPGGTTIVSQIIEPGQTGMALMDWLVPQDALAGSYSLEVYVYEYDPILQQEGVFVSSKSELYLFSVDQGYSYSETYTFAFGAKGIHIHVSEEDMNSPVVYGISTSNYVWTSRILGLALVVLDPFAPDLPFAWMNAISIIMNLNDAYLSGQDFGTVIAVGDNGADFLILQFLTLPAAFFYQHDFVWLKNIYHWPDPGIFILFDFSSVTVPGYWKWELPSSAFTVSVSAGANGQITPGTGLVNYGSTPTYSITPNTGYHIASITVNGGSVAVTSPKGQSYQFAPVTSDGSISATFALDTFTVSVSAGANGQITPGTGLVNYGSTPTYSITPNTGYHIASITVNGGSVAVTSPKGQSYQFAPVTSDGSISATFAIDTFAWPFEDGFESGSFTNWASKSNTAGETVTVVNSQKHHGTYSALSASNGNGGTERAYCYKTLPSATELYSRGYFFVSASGIAANDNRFYLLIFKAGTQSVAFAGWRMTGGVVKWTLLIRHGTSWVNVYSANSPSLNQWYSVELHWKEDATNGLGELWIDGVLVCSSSGKNTAYYGDVNRVEFGLPELVNCAATQAYVDCCVISMLPIGPESPQVSVHLESSQDTSTTSNQGTIVLDSVPYALPIDVLKTLSTYSVAYTAAAGYSFDHWEISEGISVASTNSQSTTVTVSGTGTLRAVYRAVAPPSVIFEDGFESGDFSNWAGKSNTAGETATVVNTKAKQGIYSGMFTSNGGGGTERSSCHKTIGPLTELYASGYFFVSASGIAANDNRFYFLIFKAGTQSVAFAGWRMTGGVVKWTLLIRHGTSWVSTYSANSPVLNQWYSVELHWKEDATNGFGELWVDGVRVCFSSGKNTAYYGDVNRLEFGLPELVNCGPTTVYGDSCVISKARIAPAAANQTATMTITSETKRIKQR
jgi:hypothetical protein